MSVYDPVLSTAILYREKIESYVSGQSDIKKINQYHGFEIDDEEYKLGLVVLGVICTQIIDLHNTYGPDEIEGVNRIGLFFLARDEDFLRYIRCALESNLRLLTEEDHINMNQAITHIMNMSLKGRKYEVVNVINNSLSAFFRKINEVYQKPMSMTGFSSNETNGCLTATIIGVVSMLSLFSLLF